jgi:AcrR family transcriptional regulator
LIASASRLFAEKGYVNTSVSDIAEACDVSLATFYQYFQDRTDIVSVLVAEVVREMLDRGVDRWDPRSGRMGLRRHVAPYVDGYEQHRDFFELWQTMKHVDPQLRELYRDFHGAYQERFASFMREGVELGLIRADLDVQGMATAMTLMMESYCYDIFILDPSNDPVDRAAVADLITTLWADAIGLRESDERPKRST